MRTIRIVLAIFVITIIACDKQEPRNVGSQLMLESRVYTDSEEQTKIRVKRTLSHLMLGTGETGSVSNNRCQSNSSNFWQKSDEVRIHEVKDYNLPISKIAQDLWEYAVLSENVYVGYRKKDSNWISLSAEETRLPDPTQENYITACAPDQTGYIPLPGWKLWSNFPSKKLIDDANKVGLYMEVWEKESPQKIIAVVFKGTQSRLDWISNFRWFWPRFIPCYKDQYTLITEQVGEEFVDELVKRNRCKNVSIVATGHSLGGGLAQQFAYSLPEKPNNKVPRLSHVYAFDPSPVTGWYSVSKDLRTKNAYDLQIDRIYERGEIFAYVRRMISSVHPFSVSNVRQIRFNFVKSINIFRSHSMRMLACALADAAHRELKARKQ